MHNKTPASVDDDEGNRAMRKSKSASQLSALSKKKMPPTLPVKYEIDDDSRVESHKLSPGENKTNGNSSPNHRRRSKRSSINNNALLSTVASVHELMSFVIHKDDPPAWLKQTDLFKEYANKSQQMAAENNPSTSPPHYHQQIHRKQRCNLQLYARSDQSWPALPSSLLLSPPAESRSKTRNHSNESTPKIKREANVSAVHASVSMTDVSTPLNVSIKQDPTEQNGLAKQHSSTRITRRQQMLCKKKVPQNGLRRRQRVNSVENQEPSEQKDSSSSSSQHDSDTSNSSASSIEHASPSPTTTVSRSSSHHSSPTEYMRSSGSTSARLSSPLRIQTSVSPHVHSPSTMQRRSARVWAPSNFYINPMWILPGAATTPKRLLDQQPSSSSPSPPSESTKRPRRRCRS